MENLAIYNRVRQVPQEAKKEIGGGRLKGMTDINPMWRIKTLTEQFGMVGFGWYYEILEEKFVNGANDEIAVFVKINLFIKQDGEWSKPIMGIGGSSFVTKEKNGLYTNDECLKMALTDAISIACKAIGIGADVYFAKDSTKYDIKKDEQKSNLTLVPEKKGVITSKQLQRLHTIASNKKDIARSIIEKFGYKSSKDIEVANYDIIIAEIEKAVAV